MNKPNTILKVRNLRKSFGGLRVLIDLTLDIEKEKITALIGPNGAGKTTFFNIVNGLISADSGEIRFENHDISKMKPHQIANLGIARTYQAMNNFPDLTVFENIRAGIIAKSLEYKNEEAEIYNILDLLGILSIADKNVAEITPVARRLVEVGRSMIAKPKLVLFDEIMAGFNEQETLQLIEIIRRYNAQGVTFCIIGHTMRAIMNISDTITVLHEGAVFAQGAPEQIQNNLEVQNIYFGH